MDEKEDNPKAIKDQESKKDLKDLKDQLKISENNFRHFRETVQACLHIEEDDKDWKTR
jgi:hypothetical protein